MTDVPVICLFDPGAVPPVTIDDYRRAIQAHIDTVAGQRGYESGIACASYANSTNPVWRAEAETFIEWRDADWLYVFAELSKVQAGERAQPSIEGLITELPPIIWPV